MLSDSRDQIIHEKVAPGFDRTIAYLDNLMVTIGDYTNGPADKPDPPHSHIHEQITYVAEGEVIFFKGEKRFHLSPGDVVLIPPGVPHCIQTLTSRVRLIDSFSPVRNDFLNKK